MTAIHACSMQMRLVYFVSISHPCYHGIQNFLNSITELDSNTIIEMLLSSWFSGNHPTREVVIGMKTESVVP